MTNKITVAASEVKVNDHIYNGTGSNVHPQHMVRFVLISLHFAAAIAATVLVLQK